MATIRQKIRSTHQWGASPLRCGACRKALLGYAGSPVKRNPKPKPVQNQSVYPQFPTSARTPFPRWY